MQKKGVCGMCRGKCDVIGTLENGRLIKVEADKESARGRICPRGALSPKLIYSEQRILKPLIRVGERGNADFREASWEEALDYIADKFKGIIERDGARALASYFGQSVIEDSVDKLHRTGKGFFSHIGSPNDMNCSSICNHSSNFLGPVTTGGIPYEPMTLDIEHCEAVFVWGKNPCTDQGPQHILKAIRAARERGIKLVVIDPREQGLAKEADLYLPIRPGTDGALALAMLKLVIEGEHYDKEFVENFTLGFDELCAYLDTLEVAKLADICGLTVEQIKAATEIFVSTTKIPLVSYTGIEYQLSGVQNNRAMHILWAISGKYDVEGGMLLPAHIRVRRLKDLDPENLPIGYEQYPFFVRFTGQGQFVTFPKAVLQDDPYPVRGLIVCGSSPMITYPNSDLWREVYKKLDCLVVLERYPSEDTRWADVVLPVTTMWENQSVISVPGGWRLRPRFIEPLGEAKNDVFIFAEIAKRLGFGEAVPDNDEDLGLWILNGNAELWEKVKASEYGVIKKRPLLYKKYATGELRKDGEIGFPTPSGKFEIISTLLEEVGINGLPEYRDMTEMAAEYADGMDMMMTTGARSNIRMGSMGPQFPEIAKVEPFPAVEICAEDAEARGIADGEQVRVSTVHGSHIFTAKVCGMAKGCVHIPHGGGSVYMPPAWTEGNVNDLLSMEIADPVSGFLLLKSQPCKVEKA